MVAFIIPPPILRSASPLALRKYREELENWHLNRIARKYRINPILLGIPESVARLKAIEAIYIPGGGSSGSGSSIDTPWHSWEFFGGSKTSTLAQQQAALANAQSFQQSNAGGIAVFGSGTYQHMPTCELQNHGGFLGQGFFATRLQFDASIASGSLIFNHVSTNGTTDGNAYACSVENLAIDASLLPGWSTNATDAIVWSRNPLFGSGANPGDNGEMGTDCFHRVRNVFIFTIPRDGVVALAMGEQTWENVRVYSAGRYGFQPSFDAAIVNVCSGFSHQEGYFITGNPVKLLGCKSFAAGNGGNGTNGSGFHVKAGPFAALGCESQDNYGQGVLIDTLGAAHCVVEGHIYDSNSKGLVGGFPGVDVTGSTSVILSGICQERKADGTNSPQQNAISIRNNSIISRVDLTHAAVGTATVGTPFKQADANCEIGTTNINASSAGRSIGFSAAYTPDFFTFCGFQEIVLTGNITINGPGNGPYPVGFKAVLILKQDGVGGRTITWNGIYLNTPATNVAANAFTIARLWFDGTNWICI